MKTLLIVDDEVSFLRSLSDGLKVHQDQFRVLLARNGREASRVLETERVDLILTDLKMPEMDGFELILHVNRLYPTVPMMVMTAFGTPLIEKQLRERGVWAYLEKPLDLDQLAGELLRILAVGREPLPEPISLISFLPLVAMEKLSCRLTVKSRGRQGSFDFFKGRLIDAESPGARGEEAVIAMLMWPRPLLELSPGGNGEPHVRASLDDLLLDALSRMDLKELEKEEEELAPAPDEPPNSGPAASAGPPPSPAPPDGILQGAMRRLEETLGGSLRASEITGSGEGAPLIACGAANGLSDFCRQTVGQFAQALEQGAARRFGRYVLIDLQDGAALLVLRQEPLVWGMAIDQAASRLGLLLNVVIPQAVTALADFSQRSATS